jgi:hypothetical protein
LTDRPAADGPVQLHNRARRTACCRPANGDSDMHGAPSRADREAAGRLLLCTLASPGQQEAWSRNAAAAAKGPILSDQPPGQQAGRRLPRVIMSACCEAAVPVPVRPRAASGAGGRWIHVHVHVRGWARGTSPASSSAGAGPWCSIVPPAGLGRPRGRPVFGLAMGLRWQAPAMASWLKAQPAAAAAVSCACWGVGAFRRPRPMATAA